MQYTLQNEVTFHLNGDTRACNASEVSVSVSRIRGARIQDLQVCCFPHDVTFAWHWRTCYEAFISSVFKTNVNVVLHAFCV